MSAKAISSDTVVKEVLNKREVAERYCGGCSPRHIERLATRRLMPAPVRIGGLVRWRRADLEAWLAGGCKPLNGGAK